MQLRARVIVVMAASFLSLSSAARAADRIYWGGYGDINPKMSYANLDGSGGADLSITGAAISEPYGVVIDAAAGKIYWANDADNAHPISFANLDGTGGGNLNTAGATVDNPAGLAIDPAAGRIYWANESGTPTQKISYANLDGSGGGDLDTSGATVQSPNGVAIDTATGRIYWANSSGSVPISYANLTGGGGGDLNSTGATVHVPDGVAIDPVAGRIYWANEANSGSNGISYANLNNSGGGNLTTTGATVDNPTGVAIDPGAGKIYWANTGASNAVSFANLNGTGGGNVTTTGATANGPAYPALLEAPSAAGAPTITGGSTTGSQLSCTQGSWAADLLGSFLFRAPRSFAYQWTVNGADIAGATSSSYTASSPGSYGCRVTASNDAGSATQTSVAHVVSPPPPRLTKVKQSHRRWREGNALPHIASAKRPPIGTTLRFTVNESVRVRFVFTQRGHKRGKLSFSAAAGAHKLRFQGRLSKHKRLKPGRYTLIVTATNAAGQRATAKLKFTIVRG